ncbi:MAG: DUF4440 domain-containing protein [Bacteroidota bacterium]|uniref:DUF4440 domain-containing protein n=1 Tax=Flagellimonas okinawensis TaxID=3031324 RepID=A0ABT5XJJ6_9FLAO|nr:DUF4440 domain-containing protein [[Muricauda] okinawensis]MDF0706065.1 DUF4440 domain-containing protein [[Muricauda] okinawensis]MEC8831313.1 DUF4440 domain-containing protein [Bacteroidota bacterium]
MKNLVLVFLITALLSCQGNPSDASSEKETESVHTLDKDAELAKIQEVRNSFQKTVKEKRYGDLGQFVTDDLISIGPGSEDWIAYRKLREQYGNKFRYDSIKMNPIETVILSDTMAYDFGVSSVFYTDENGTVHEMEDTFLVIMKKTKEGEWKLFRELASSLVVD